MAGGLSHPKPPFESEMKELSSIFWFQVATNSEVISCLIQNMHGLDRSVF